MRSARFREEVSSDARFQLLFDRLLRRSAKANEPEEIRSGETVIARLAKARRGARLDIEGEDFAAFVARRLPELHAAFQAEREEDG